MDKYTFPPSGATGCLVTPSHKLGQTFKFKDYAPKVFKKIREHFGVDKVGSGGSGRFGLDITVPGVRVSETGQTVTPHIFIDSDWGIPEVW